MKTKYTPQPPPGPGGAAPPLRAKHLYPAGTRVIIINNISDRDIDRLVAVLSGGGDHCRLSQ